MISLLQHQRKNGQEHQVLLLKYLVFLLRIDPPTWTIIWVDYCRIWVMIMIIMWTILRSKLRLKRMKIIRFMMLRLRLIIFMLWEDRWNIIIENLYSFIEIRSWLKEVLYLQKMSLLKDQNLKRLLMITLKYLMLRRLFFVLENFILIWLIRGRYRRKKMRLLLLD